jgi:phospholipid/cholesterol/gamma-HCH transport system permease protein
LEGGGRGVDDGTNHARQLIQPPPVSAAADPPPAPARATTTVRGHALEVEVGGRWRLRAPRPDDADIFAQPPSPGVRQVILVARDLEEWDSSLLLFVQRVRAGAAARNLPIELRDLPAVFHEWLAQFAPAAASDPAPPHEKFPITRHIGRWAQARADKGRGMLGFLGECVLGLGRVLVHPRDFRWADSIFQMRRCGAQALGIVGLITFLVGVILAFVAAVQLRQFGADIFVANLTGLAILREMGPMMAAIVLAGRTGAAFAAELGNMKLNEEIDALATFGLRPHDFLVMPRLVALVLMMPLLALYADFLGVLGGAMIAQTVLDVPPVSFFRQLQSAVSLNDLGTGLLKSVFFGIIVAYAGCLKGMRAGRSAIGVGEATTSAVVLAILLIIVSYAIFTVIFNVLRW